LLDNQNKTNRVVIISKESSNQEEIEEYPEMIAAVDLGSNSFHMIVARVDANSAS